MPFGCFSVDVALACHFMTPTTAHPYRNFCGMGYASKNWQPIQLAVHLKGGV